MKDWWRNRGNSKHVPCCWQKWDILLNVTYLVLFKVTPLILSNTCNLMYKCLAWLQRTTCFYSSYIYYGSKGSEQIVLLMADALFIAHMLWQTDIAHFMDDTSIKPKHQGSLPYIQIEWIRAVMIRWNFGFKDFIGVTPVCTALKMCIIKGFIGA